MPLKPENKQASNQCWRTPPEFLDAVRRRFGCIDFDLAATRGHQVVGDYSEAFFSPEEDSLAQDWRNLIMPPGEDSRKCRVAWLNPPFAHIEPWAKKLAECSDLPRWTLMLVPASVGSKWWAKHLLGKTMGFGVPRMKFVGADAMYPKDLALFCAGFGVGGFGYWDWREKA